KLREETSGNLFMSPSSVIFALAMTYAGAKNETARQMASVLRFDLPSDRLHEALRALRANTRTGGIELRIANRLWAQKGYHVLAEFLDTTERCYGTQLGEVDFRTSAEKARQQINRWIEEQTANRITDLVPPRALDEMTRLVLTNAIYFLGCWESEFDAANTRLSTFWTTPTEQVPTSMMTQTGYFNSSMNDDLQALEMPYRSRTFEVRPAKFGNTEVRQLLQVPDGGSDFAICILLPRKIDGLKDIEARLSPATIHEWTTLRACHVDVQVPRYRVESMFSLNKAL